MTEIVDERQRLVARLRGVMGGGGRETWQAAADQIEADGKRLTDLDKLNDPVAVHVNLLRGTIAKPSLANIIHLYGAEALSAALASRPQEQPRKATEQEVDAACRAYAIAANKPYIPEAMVAAITAAVNIAVSTVSVSPAAAQGWQMVPVEATEAMIAAGEAAYWNATSFVRAATMADAYRAMLTAAPPSPAAQEQEKGEPT